MLVCYLGVTFLNGNCSFQAELRTVEPVLPVNFVDLETGASVGVGVRDQFCRKTKSP